MTTVTVMAELERTMHVAQVDEREGGWEDSAPRFRVYLHGSAEGSTGGWTDTYDITGADVLQAIDWAQRQAGDRLTYAVALVRDDTDQEQLTPGLGRGLAWLVGMDGNDATTEGSSEGVVQRRMLYRRVKPVGIPEADRAPPDVVNPHAVGFTEL